MEGKEFKDALEALKSDLEGKSKQEVKDAFEAFETKYNEVLKLEQKDLLTKSEFEAAQNDIKDGLAAVQDHLDKLDVKLNKAKPTEVKTPVDAIKEGIKENFESIKKVKKGNSFNMDIKAVGDMTLGASLTGDQYRSYSTVVAANPSHKVNFSDLIGSIPIGTGTYTFPREGTVEGSIATQTEGSNKSQIDTALTHVDVSTDFLAGYARYSKKMANNVSYLEGFLPQMLRREYLKSESSAFYTTLAAAATVSAQRIASNNKVEMLLKDAGVLAAADFEATAIVVPAADYFDILITEKSTGAGYGLPGVVAIDNGRMTINGIPVVIANWLPATKYLVCDWSTISKVVTEGLSVQFSTEDGDNFKSNMITARVEAQVGLAIHRPDACILGDFDVV